MKLRIHDDTIRLRLTQSEVSRIAAGLGVESVCRFPDRAVLTYALVVADTSAIAARLCDGRVEVTLPRNDATRWATSNNVALQRDARDNGGLQILVEKDFACIEPRDGDDAADLYPNPKARPS
jgi:hypothetical protein